MSDRVCVYITRKFIDSHIESSLHILTHIALIALIQRAGRRLRAIHTRNLFSVIHSRFHTIPRLPYHVADNQRVAPHPDLVH